MAPAPWDSLPAEKTLFTLVTGANSGIGFGIGQRLIDEFLASRSLDSHLILIPTTRSVKKSQETIDALRQYAKKQAQSSKSLISRAGPDYKPQQTTRRIHILSVQLDLCNIPSIKKAADQLVNGTITSLSDDADFESLVDVRLPRLDAIILNAGIGGWTGIDWLLLTHNFLTEGIRQATTYPKFKAGIVGLTVNPLPGSKSPTSQDAGTTTPILGEVFCANVFGHYIFAHSVLPLLVRSTTSACPPGRIIWESSIEPVWASLALSDFQALKIKGAYESSKRVTDILALTSNLPSVKPYSRPFLTPPDTPVEKVVLPKIYLAHPGVVATTIMPLHWFLFFGYRMVIYLSRLLGSPWHVVTAYKGAMALVWLALAGQETLDEMDADRAKWGAACDRWGNEAIRRTEVEGWGWNGDVDDRNELARDEETKMLRKMVGRKVGAADLTEEKKVEFEELGVEVWKRMEDLRIEWTGRMEKGE